jgi:hypothetical protein
MLIAKCYFTAGCGWVILLVICSSGESVLKKYTKEIKKMNAILNSIYEEALKRGSHELVNNN